MKRVLLFLLLVFSTVVAYCQVKTSFEAQENQLNIEEYEKLYSKLYYEDATEYVTEEGSPALPVLTKIYLLPPHATSSFLLVSLSGQVAIEGEYLVFPVQPPGIVSEETKKQAFVSPNPVIYDSDQMFPLVPFELTEEDIFGYRVCKVKMYPFSYLPAEKKLFLNTFKIQENLETAVYKSESSQVESKESALRRKLARDYILSLVENPSDLSVYYPTQQIRSLSTTGIIPVAKSDSIPDYLIITNEELKPTFQTLADWKTKKGFVTYIKTVEEIYSSYPGIDRQEKIRNYIIESVQKWGSSLFVLLGGDVNIIPEREHLTENTVGYGRIFFSADSYYANTNPKNTWNANSDNIFGDAGDGAIYSKDIVLGRIPADSKIKASTLIDKILDYERANGKIDYTYFNNSLLIAAPIQLGTTPAGDSNAGIRELINAYDTFLKTKMGCRFLIDQRYTSYSGNSSMCQKISGLYSHLTKASFIESLNGSAIKPHIVYHMDHSGPQSMGASNKTENQGITNADVDMLTNGEYYQIIMTGGCHPGNFSKDCIGEHFLFKDKGGAIAFLGNTDVGWSGEGYMFTRFIKGIFNNASNRLGLGYNSIFELSSKWNMHLLGDPEMPVWTAAPKELNVTATFQRQMDRSYILTVNAGNLDSRAIICISKEKDLYYVGELSNGTSQYALSPAFSGKLSVVVTAQNHRPFVEEIGLVGVLRSELSYKEVTLSDASGNGDGKADAGETVSLKLNIKSNYSLAINDLKATVSCNNPFVRLATTQVNWGALVGHGLGEASFSFTVDKDAEERLQSAQDATTFHFEVTDASGKKFHLEDVKIDIWKPELSMELTEMNTLPVAGRTYMLKCRVTNTSYGKATGLQAVFSGSHIYTRSLAWADLTPGQDIINRNSVVIKSTYLGGSLPVTVTITNQYGKTWTQNFDLSALPNALSVTNDKFDYTCDAQWIQVYWNHRSGVKGYNVYRSDVNERGVPTGSYSKQNKELLRFPFYTDNDVEELTAYSYKASVVSSSGIESPLSDPFTGCTSFRKVGLFPITAYDWGSTGPRIDAPVLTEDINGDSKREIFTSLQDYSGWGAIIGVDANGNDLYDLDNNITSHSGFVRVEQEICAAPAIGSLKKGQANHLFFAERGEGSLSNLYCYSFNDVDTDGKPDFVWKNEMKSSSLKSVILANVDGSTDGSNEIVLRGEGNSASGHKNIKVFSNAGELLYSFGEGGTYAGLAVADLDGDGDMEIIAGYGDGKVQAYNYDGSVYRTLLNVSGKQFNSTPVVCDIDNDGVKEVLIMGKSGGRASVYVRKADGSTVPGWNDASVSQSVVCSTPALDHPLSLGDLNNDGEVEIVVVETNYIRIWKNNGTLLHSIYLLGLTPQTAILADVDGDNEAEIVVSLPFEVHAYKLDGTRVKGFPLRVSDQIYSTPTVADIDNDGINEVIVAGRNSLCAWKTNGNADVIEWGTAYHNNRNTSEYICPPQKIRDNVTWNQPYYPCGDLVVSKGTLTLNSGCTLRLRNEATLIVESGATLKINGGLIDNADVQVMRGGKLEIINGGRVILRKNGFFTIQKGVSMNYNLGSISFAQ